MLIKWAGAVGAQDSGARFGGECLVLLISSSCFSYFIYFTILLSFILHVFIVSQKVINP